MTWPTLLALAVVTYLFKAFGPLGAGGRQLPKALKVVVDLLPPALLAALVAVETLGSGAAISLDARLAGVAAAALAVWLRAPFLVVIIAGTATAALLRAAGLG